MKSILLSISVVAVLLAIPALAHHSFTMFDMTKKITLSGTVTAFEWTNPHSYIEIDVADESGATKHWSIEMGSIYQHLLKAIRINALPADGLIA